MIEIVLNWNEVDLAARDAVVEYFQSRKQNLHHRPGFAGRIDNFWTYAIEGHCGQIAVARHIDAYYLNRTGQFRAPDVAGVQVKTRLSHRYELRVRANDPDDLPYLLVTRDLNDECAVYRLHGWLYGHEAKRPEWLNDPDGSGEKNFFVPQDALHPLETLPIKRNGDK